MKLHFSFGGSQKALGAGWIFSTLARTLLRMFLSKLVRIHCSSMQRLLVRPKRLRACKGESQSWEVESRVKPHRNYPDVTLVDWKHKAAVFYYNAVSLLLQAIKNNGAGSPDQSDSDHRQHITSHEENVPSPERRRTPSKAGFVSSTDEVLAASAILCVYEFLDTSVSEWAKHLSGAKSLLVLAQDRMTPLQVPTPGSSVSSASSSFVSKAHRAAFWNIARQDMLAACKLFILRRL